jgi:indolepyruvate ferredoxin oxidoreductase beta subunit
MIPYPEQEEIMQILSSYTDEIYTIPATGICLEVGNPRALNMVMLGSLSVFLDLEPEAWVEDIRHRVPQRFIESSLEAFNRGADEIKTMREIKATGQ